MKPNYAVRRVFARLCCCVLTVLAGISVPVLAQTATPFIMGFDEDPNDFGTQWSQRIYTEAFKRLGIPFKAGYYPLGRRAAMSDEGTIDGDAARVHAYGNAHPNLVRVDESVMDFGFALYTGDPAVQLARLDDLANTSFLVEYRRGIFFCETQMKQRVDAKRLSDVTTEVQGVNKLLARRTDLYCDLETVVRQAMRQPEFKDATRLRKVLQIGVLQTYPYLHKKHAALAPRLAAVIQDMKREGLVERYRQEAERHVGWAP